MKQVQVQKQAVRRPVPQDTDRRSPSGRKTWSN